MERIISKKRKLDLDVLQKLYHDVPSVDPARVSFLTRLKTYTVSVWADKPFDPPMCARLGWEVVESDMLKCVMCSQYLSVSLPSPAKQQSFKEARSKLKTRLSQAHSKFCIYTSNPLPDSVLQIEKLSKVEALEKIKGQVARFEGLIISLNFSRNEVDELFSWFVETTGLSQAHLSNFVLSLTGWEYLKKETSVTCDYCNRKWSLEGHIITCTSEEALPVDPISQHQRWCAWRAEKVGWELRLEQLQQLKESRSDNSKRSRLSSANYVSLTEGMKSVRKMLNGTL